jgi:hypothetical protein
MSSQRGGKPQQESSGMSHSSRGWRAPQKPSTSTDPLDELMDFNIPGCDNTSSTKRTTHHVEPSASVDIYSSHRHREGPSSVKQLNQPMKKLTIDTDFSKEDKDIDWFGRADEGFSSFAASVGKTGKRENITTKSRFPAPLQPNPPLPTTLSFAKSNKVSQGEGNVSRNSSTPGTPAREGNAFFSGDKAPTTSFPSFLGHTSSTPTSEFEDTTVTSPYASSSEEFASTNTDAVFSKDSKFTTFAADTGLFSPRSDSTVESRSRASSEDEGRNNISSLPSGASENKVFFPNSNDIYTSFSPGRHCVSVPFVEAEWKVLQEFRRENCLTRNELSAIVDRAVDRRLAGNPSMTCTKLVELCNEGKAYVADILLILSSRPITNDAAMTLKCLYLLHRLCLEGPIDCIWQGRHDSLSLLDSLSKSWAKPKNENLAVHPARSINSRYASFLLEKHHFHLEFPEFETNYSLDRFFRRLEIEQVDEVQRAHNNERYLKVISYSTSSRLLFLLESIIRVLKNLIERRHLGPCVEVCIFPCIEEAKGLHVICVYLFSKLLKMPPELVQISRSEQEDMITNFEELHKILRSTFQVFRSLELTDIPELPPVLTLPNAACQRPESRDTFHIKCHFHSFEALHKAFEPEHAPEVW